MSTYTRPFHIVVGFDFSPLAELAFEEGARLANQNSEAILHVVCVVEEITDQALNEATAYIKAFGEGALTRTGAENGTRVFAHILRGDPAGELLSVAEDVEADVVVVGTHGRRGVKRLLLGSVAEKVMRNANCPVLVMRQTTYEAHPELQPEPACPECMKVRKESAGARWWCEVHARPWQPPHRYSYEGGYLHPYHPDQP